MSAKKIFWSFRQNVFRILSILGVCQWIGSPGFNPRSSHTKDSKMLLDASLLNTQHYKVRIKCKESNTEKGVLLYKLVISITTVLQMHIQIQIHRRTLAVLLTSDFGSSTQGETQNFYYADDTFWPHERAAHPVMLKISVGRDPKNSTLRLNGWIPNYSTSRSNLNFQLTLFQNPRIRRTISSEHDIFRSPAPLPVWGFIMTMVIVISFANERKTVPNDFELFGLRVQVQSPTKLNDKI